MEMRWTKTNTVQFIDLYRNQRVLWDPGHPHYYNKIRKHDAWEAIGQSLKCSGDKCKKKMVSLLSAMRREKAKIKKSMGTAKGADNVYESTWFAYNSMKFILDKDTSCSTSSLQSEEEMCTTIMQSPLQSTVAETMLIVHSLNSPQQPSSPSPQPSNLSLPLITPSQLSQNAPLRKRKKLTEDDRLNKAFEILTNTTLNSDESQDFGNFVAKKLRKYTSTIQCKIQNAIMGIFLDADSGLYEQRYHTYDLPINPPCTISNSSTSPTMVSEDSS